MQAARKTAPSVPLKKTVARNSSALGSSSPRVGTPTRSSPLAAKPSLPAPNASPPSKNLTGLARESSLTKQVRIDQTAVRSIQIDITKADSVLQQLEASLQDQTDEIMTKLEEMSVRVTSLDDIIQGLIRDDFDEDPSSTPRPTTERMPSLPTLDNQNRPKPPRRTSTMRMTLPLEADSSLLSEQSPFDTENPQ
ncbi:SubName: Full=Uncharacterized protein {ECO:0000313/EMBL:CCA70419.1} [Serendipita indica DSM 11827]|nr:SubName: Full=Uncharacterized protein {ECO:0000313/EMBL:CCA70419.1} [Serendipita indica DSM 11827]